jgi:hypothetical protein
MDLGLVFGRRAAVQSGGQNMLGHAKIILNFSGSTN